MQSHFKILEVKAPINEFWRNLTQLITITKLKQIIVLRRNKIKLDLYLAESTGTSNIIYNTGLF
jgi:hypothetical protein